MTALAPERPARFAGAWYPDGAEALAACVDAALAAARDGAPAPARAVVAPHAGYRYSLPIAAAAYARVVVPEVVVVLCPNHTVPPPIVSAWSGGPWRTPLGAVAVAADLLERLRAASPLVVAEARAHRDEHAVELHLPLLQRLRAGRPLRVAPVVVAAPRTEDLLALGDALADAIGGDDVLVVASSDMNHHEPADVTRRKDERALRPLLALDPAGLLAACEAERVSMCGVRPTAVALQAARRLGATRAELARYGHSGEVSGDDRRVVGYAGVVVR
ncbi:MAG: AmmeMemoRadiSam system protein B [Planctomycetes bacterium]|nr:AmmeMemoRadiSam system protein B [Planctomycetota bacterium]